MRPTNGGRLALAITAVLLLQLALSSPFMAGALGDDGGDRLPTGYLTVFQDDFESGVIDTGKWVYWEGPWSTDNVMVNPAGGYFTGDDIYLTQSPRENGFGSPLDDNGNGGTYLPDEESMMETAWIDLHNLSTPRLEFSHMFDMPSQGDGAMVFVMTDDDQEWQLVEPDSPYPGSTGWTGTVSAWVQVAFRLDEYAGERIRIGLYFRSSPDGLEGDGWKINNFEVGGRSTAQLPDLRLGNTRILLDGYPVQAAVAGDVLDFNMTVLNEGRAHSGPFIVSAYTDHPLVGGLEIGREVVMDGLAVGTSMTLSMRWVAIAGNYDVLIILDETNEIFEENEKNNQRRIHVDVDDTSSGDIVVWDMRFEADTKVIHGAGVGDLISIVATLENVGTSVVSTPMVVQAFDGPPTAGSQPIGDVQPTFNGVEPGGTRIIDIPWRPLAGLHVVYLLVSPQDPAQMLDFNDMNNITWAEILVTDDPGVDLRVDMVEFSLRGSVTTLANQGDNVHITTVLSNRGTAPFEGVMEVDIYRGDPDSGGVRIGQQLAIVNLGPDRTYTFEFDWRVDLGTHAVTIFVDPQNKVYELNEYNNQLGKGLTVTRHSLSDLKVSSMGLLLNGVPLDPEVGTNEGATVEVNITVWNAGNEKTKSPTTTELYLGNPLIDDTKLLGSFIVPEGLNPDEVFVKSIMWVAEKPRQKGDVPILFVRVDSKDVEPEASEFNNLEHRPLMVGTKLPDLTVVSVSITDQDGVPVNSMTYGTSVDITVTSTNIGTDISFQVAQLSIFLDSTDPSDRIATISTSTMGIGETIVRKHTWSPDPAKVPGGEHVIIVAIDPVNEIEESSDANNNITTSLFVDADALPNLLLQDMWVTQGEKVIDSIDSGEKATVHLRVLNLGAAPLYTTTAVELFFGDPTQGGEPVASWPLESLGNGMGENQVTFEVDWTFDRTAPLMVFIDRNHVVPEVNEQDNIGSHQISVNPEQEGTNWLVIGAVIVIGVVVFLAMTVLLRGNPLKVPDEEEGLDERPPRERGPEPAAARKAEEASEPAPEEPVEAPAEAPDAAPDEGLGEEPTGEGAPEAATTEDVPETATAEDAPETAMAEDAMADGPAGVPVCPSCGEQVDQDWILCPFCDHQLK